MNPSASEPVSAPPSQQSFSKIVATIGPASEDRLEELVAAGLSVARLNLSHGDLEDHKRRIERIRRVSHDQTIPVGILADLQGPKMRLGLFEGGQRTLVKGERVILRPGSEMSAPDEILVNVDELLSCVEPGHRALLADGQVEVRVTEKLRDGLVGEVRRGGEIGDRKGVHLPDSAVPYRLPTPQDVEHIAFLKEHGVDMIAVSFVSEPEELRRVRALAPGIPIVAKIERAAALENLDGLLAEADGLMVARGDLGVEIELDRLPLVQKDVIQKALEAGKFTITATEMLESMVDSSRPTRAEVTDVANAILDGTDAVMLSAETAVGRHPVEAVATMVRVARSVESSPRYFDAHRAGFRAAEADFSNATALAAVQAAEALGISRIVCFTETGNTARLLSRYRPSAEIVALSPNPGTVGSMTVLGHVRPLLFRRESSLEDMLYMASEMLVVRELGNYGDEIVFVAGVPPGISRSTNVMKLHRIGEEVRLH